MGRAKKKATSRAKRRAVKPPPKDEKLEALAEELRDLAEAVGIQVRREKLMREVGYHARSGMCRVAGEDVLLIDSQLTTEMQVDLLVGALEARDLSEVPVSEEAQRALAKQESVA